MIDWLLTPLSGAAEHAIPVWAAWHGRLMVLAWTILLPSGMFIARFLKVWPGQPWPDRLDHPIWWRSHLWLQSAGLVAMLAALTLAYNRGPGGPGAPALHHTLGYTIATLAAIQLLSGLFRGSKGGPSDAALRGDHYDMTLRRLVFEWLHKHLGWIALLLSIATTAIGLMLADAPRWMPLTLLLWWSAFLAAFAALQRRGWCIDTYQAIWGPDPTHPGNQRPRPIGLGTRRRS